MFLLIAKSVRAFYVFTFNFFKCMFFYFLFNSLNKTRGTKKGGIIYEDNSVLYDKLNLSESERKGVFLTLSKSRVSYRT